MENKIEINQPEMLQAINRAEVDMQIATAKQYPRNIHSVLNTISTYSTMDAETAESCFYALRRFDEKGNPVIIEGLSVRMAEIIAGSWGNMRVQTRIIGNDGKTITAQGICHDLETNLAVSVEVKRRITRKDGKTFSEDMQVVTGNAASSIAFRNAVLKVVPKAVIKRVIEDAKQVAIGKAIDLETGRKNALENFSKAGVTAEMILFYLRISKIEEIDKEKLFSLRSAWNAIKEGDTTVEEEFIKPMKAAEEAKKTVADKKAGLKEKKTSNTGTQAPEMP
jgi:hypothetical protein